MFHPLDGPARTAHVSKAAVLAVVIEVKLFDRLTPESICLIDAVH